MNCSQQQKTQRTQGSDDQSLNDLTNHSEESRYHSEVKLPRKQILQNMSQNEFLYIFLKPQLCRTLRQFQFKTASELQHCNHLRYKSFLNFLFSTLKKIFFNSKFIWRESGREREREGESGRANGRGVQRIPSRLHTVSKQPNAGLELTDCEIMA